MVFADSGVQEPQGKEASVYGASGGTTEGRLPFPKSIL